MAQSVRIDPMAPQRVLKGTNERAFQQREEGGQISPPALSTPTALALQVVLAKEALAAQRRCGAPEHAREIIYAFYTFFCLK